MVVVKLTPDTPVAFPAHLIIQPLEGKLSSSTLPVVVRHDGGVIAPIEGAGGTTVTPNGVLTELEQVPLLNV